MSRSASACKLTCTLAEGHPPALTAEGHSAQNLLCMLQTFWRGFFLASLTRVLPLPACVAISSIGFAALHLTPANLLPILMLAPCGDILFLRRYGSKLCSQDCLELHLVHPVHGKQLAPPHMCTCTCIRCHAGSGTYFFLHACCTCTLGKGYIAASVNWWQLS